MNKDESVESCAEENISVLLQQLKQGSEPAFNALYNLHSKILFCNIRNLVKDTEIAKEILQDLYLKVWQNRTSVDAEKSFKSFLFTIARNMVYDHLRKAALDKRSRIKLMTNAIEFYTHTEENLDLKESKELIRIAIETLPPQCKQVYIYSKLEGKSHYEISSLLGISISTVNNHIVKGNREVRAFLFRHSGLAILFLAASAIRHL